MLKKFLFTVFLACFALSANAQIATPQLDNGFKTYGGAAAGWRYGSTISFVGLIVDGKVELDGEEVGDVVGGLNAKGPEDSSNPLPFMLAAYRGETFAAELYTNLGDGLKTDIELDKIPGVNTSNTYKEERELRMNLAYIFGDTFSIGLGYSSENDKKKEEFAITNFLEYESEDDVTTVGTSLTGSFRLADIFFVAAGMEMVKQTGTEALDIAVNLANPALVAYDEEFVENSWTNTMFGLGIVTGDPGETQFRVEYSMITSPESEEKETGKMDSSHPQTTTTFISAEAKFGDFLLAYFNETEKEAELNDEETETVISSTGIGWKPLEGLTVSLYMTDYKQTLKDTAKDTESIVNPTGYRFIIGYNF